MTNLPSITGTRTRMGRTNPVTLTNLYVTQCKVCGLSVLKTHEYRWATDPVGISHTECLDKENTDA